MPWHDFHKYLLFSLNPCQHFDGQSWSCWFCLGGFYLFIWDLGRCFAALRALFGFTSRWQRNCSSFSLPWEQSKALIQVRKAISTTPLLRRPFAAHISVVLRWNRSRLLTLLLIECLAATFQGSLLFRSHLSRLRKPICFRSNQFLLVQRAASVRYTKNYCNAHRRRTGGSTWSRI